MPGWIDCKPSPSDPNRWEAFRSERYRNTILKLIKDNAGTPVIVLAMNNTGYACIPGSRIMGPDDTQHIDMAVNFLRTHTRTILADGAAMYFLSPKKYWRDLDDPHEWNRNEERYAVRKIAAENIPGFVYVKGVWEDTAKYKELALVGDGHHPTHFGDEIIASKFFRALLEHDGLPVPAWDQEEVDAARIAQLREMGRNARLPAAATPGAQPELAWKQTDHSLALSRGPIVVWQFNYKREEGKPYFHPITVAGSSALTDLRPADHPWHRALWFSWKYINGVLYWEEDPKTGKAPGETELTDIKATARADHSAHFELALKYHPPGKPAVLTEKRTLDVSPPAADGAYFIDWLGVFTAGDTDVRLDRTPILGQPNGVSYGGYAGLSLRLAPALRGWQFADSEGPVNTASKDARWMSFAGPIGQGKSAAIIVLDHPKSFRHPAPWYLIGSMPYFSPAVLYREPYTLPARKSITLKYRILFQPAAFDRDAAERQWQQFSKHE